MSEAERESFLRRWSRLKRGGAAEERSERSAGAPAEPGREEERIAPAAGQEAAEPLPDPDSLPPDGDFSVFLREGVPEMLRQKALRRLWRTNPIIRTVDMLDDYCEDFTDAATVVAGLQTAIAKGREALAEAREKLARADETLERGEDAQQAAEERSAEPPPPPPTRCDDEKKEGSA